MAIIERTQNFFKEVFVELKKVNWLSRNEVIRYTILVLVITILVSAVLGGLDYLFSTLVQKFVVK